MGQARRRMMMMMMPKWRTLTSLLRVLILMTMRRIIRVHRGTRGRGVEREWWMTAAATIQGTFGVIQGTFGVIQGTFGVLQGTFGVIQGTFGVI
jgi:hypothetical protein